MIDVRHYISLEKEDILGENDWFWPTADKDLHNKEYGPVCDWIQDFNEKYFKYLRGNNVVVTAGAHAGLYVRFYAKRFKHVIAFEPNPVNFHCLVNNNPYHNVVKLNASTGDINTMTGFAMPPGEYSGMGRICATSQSDVLIPSITIDTLHLDACDLIQLDVEGHEFAALLGARHTIFKFRPVIIAERLDAPQYKEMMMNVFNYTYVETSHLDSFYLPTELVQITEEESK